MSEPRKKSLEQAKALRCDLSELITRDGEWDTSDQADALIAEKFDAIRREERAKSVELANAGRVLSALIKGGRHTEIAMHEAQQFDALYAAWEGSHHD